MTELTDQLKQKLQMHKYSVTKPRLAVFMALLDQEPLTMHQLVDKLPNIDRATIYRVIELFTNLGIVERLHIGWKYKLELSDDFQHHHHHLTCTHCHSTITLAEDHELETLLQGLAANANFHITSHQVEISGVCQSCRGR